MNKDNAKDYLPLVQALADGKVIQGRMAHSGLWEDMSGNIRFYGKASDYRIKPEPREIWINRHVDGYNSDRAYSSKELAEIGIQDGWEPVHYREVIE